MLNSYGRNANDGNAWWKGTFNMIEQTKCEITCFILLHTNAPIESNEEQNFIFNHFIPLYAVVIRSRSFSNILLVFIVVMIIIIIMNGYFQFEQSRKYFPTLNYYFHFCELNRIILCPFWFSFDFFLTSVNLLFWLNSIVVCATFWPQYWMAEWEMKTNFLSVEFIVQSLLSLLVGNLCA